jgi:Xaa-Pro aminopeptidase
VTSPAAATEARADRLVDVLAERELDCLLVTNLVNVRYLTGFTGTNGACIVSRDQRLFLTDFRYTEQAEEQVHGFDRVQAERDMLADVARRLSGRAGFEDSHLTVKAYRKIAEKTGEGVELAAAGEVVEGLREVKDASELGAMAAAAELANEVYEHLRERGMAGRTELEVARELEREIRDRGGDPAFPVIVASGSHGARPHAEPRDVEISGDTLVVVDMGARLDGYCSDCTRTFATGDLDDEALEVYELVRSAQEGGLEAARAGAACRDVDGAARAVIEAAGQGELFGHGLGHGVGLEVHEGPRLTKSAECHLRAGNTVTVEPGVYLPGRFGVRIEDLVAITEDGCDVMTPFPKTLVTLD